MKLDWETQAKVAEGYAIMTRALGLIGDTERNDHDLAHIVVDGEMSIRALLDYAIKNLAQSG